MEGLGFRNFALKGLGFRIFGLKGLGFRNFGLKGSRSELSGVAVSRASGQVSLWADPACSSAHHSLKKDP